MDKNHFCYEPFNFKENLFHDRHWYLSFLFFPMILWNFYYRNHILRVWTFPPKASRRRGRKTWQVRLIPIEFFRYALHVPTYSRYLDRFTWLSYIHYIYFTLCFGKSLALYLPCHRTLHPPSNLQNLRETLSFASQRSNEFLWLEWRFLLEPWLTCKLVYGSCTSFKKDLPEYSWK